MTHLETHFSMSLFIAKSSLRTNLSVPKSTRSLKLSLYIQGQYFTFYFFNYKLYFDFSLVKFKNMNYIAIIFQCNKYVLFVLDNEVNMTYKTYESIINLVA